MNSPYPLKRFIFRAGRKQLIGGAVALAGGSYLFTQISPDQTELRVGLGVIAGLGLLFVLFGLTKLLVPGISKAYRMAAAIGDVNEIEMYLSLAEEGGNLIFSADRVLVTRKYIAGLDLSRPVVVKTEDLMWAYRHVTVTKKYGRETGRSTAIVMAFHGRKKTLQFGVEENVTQECLESIAQNLPSVILGFSKERSDLLRKNRAEFEAEWRRCRDMAGKA